MDIEKIRLRVCSWAMILGTIGFTAFAFNGDFIGTGICGAIVILGGAFFD